MELEPYSSKILKCRVCGSLPAQFHFGAIACRSCAAFFRRFVNSRKSFVQCTCNQQSRSSYACRLCRMKKCLAVGMNKCLVQQPREKNTSVSRTDHTESRININHLVLRAFERVRRVKNNYDFVNSDREIMKTLSIHPGDINYFQLSVILRQDYHLLSKMILKTFPELNQLSTPEKNVLFMNFYPKWCVFESTLMEVKHSCLDSWWYETPFGEKEYALKEFYYDNDGNPVELPVEKLSMFNTYWTYMLFDFKKLVGDVGLDDIEEMCVLALLFFDTGYSNLSLRSVEMCEKMKKCIYRELSAYCMEKHKNELRFFEVLDVLPLIEKGEEKNYEELQLCCLHNIMVDQEYYRIMTASRS